MYDKNILKNKKTNVNSFHILNKKDYTVIPQSSNDYLLHFIPKNYQYLTQQKKIVYKGVNLKTTYIISIIHELLVKYYFSNTIDIKFNLSSIILRKRYGANYNYYIDYLMSEGFISLVSKYFVGKKTNSYKIIDIESVYDVIRWKNTDKKLIKKSEYRFETTLTETSKTSIPNDIRVKLIESLDKINIDYENAYNYLNDKYNNNEIDEHKYHKNLMSIENIASKNIYFNFDDYGRFHTNYTILKREIRNQYLSINNEMTAEIDINNSQPLFFAVLLKTQLPHINGDTKKYFDLVKNGLLYDDIINNSQLKTKPEAKELIYKVLFGDNVNAGKRKNKIFRDLYPSVYEYILEFKENRKNYKELSHELQKMESNFIFNTVIKEIYETYPEIILFTVHDSIIFPKSYYDRVKVIYDKHFKNLISIFDKKT